MVEEQTMFKNKTANLLMSAGVEYERRRLHGKRQSPIGSGPAGNFSGSSVERVPGRFR
jgi:hypothetical protein